jgi:hypothetical protein
MTIAPVNVSASVVSDEGGYERNPTELKNNVVVNKRPFSFGQHWPNVIERDGDVALSMSKLKNKVVAYNVYASGYKAEYPYNSTPVIRIGDNATDTDSGLFPYMTDNDWFSVDVAFVAETQSMISNEVFRVFFKYNSNGLNDIPYVSDTVTSIVAKGTQSKKEWVTLGDTRVDYGNLAFISSAFDPYGIPVGDKKVDSYDLLPDPDSTFSSIYTYWVKVSLPGATNELYRKYQVMDRNLNSYVWLPASRSPSPDLNYSVYQTTGTGTTKAIIPSSIGGDLNVFGINEPLPRGNATGVDGVYPYSVGDYITKLEYNSDKRLQYMTYQLQSVSGADLEPQFNLVWKQGEQYFDNFDSFVVATVGQQTTYPYPLKHFTKTRENVPESSTTGGTIIYSLPTQQSEYSSFVVGRKYYIENYGASNYGTFTEYTITSTTAYTSATSLPKANVVGQRALVGTGFTSTSKYYWYTVERGTTITSPVNASGSTITTPVVIPIKIWTRSATYVNSISTIDKLVKSLPFADENPVGTIVYMDTGRGYFDQYKVVLANPSSYEPNDRYENFENYGNFQTSYIGASKYAYKDDDGTIKGCQYYEWKGNNGGTTKKKWVLTDNYDPNLKVGNPINYVAGTINDLPDPNLYSVGTTVLYTNFDRITNYYSVDLDTSNTKNILCKVFYHPKNKEVWASAQYTGASTTAANRRCQVIIRRIQYWPPGTSTMDQDYPAYASYYGYTPYYTNIDPKIVRVFQEIDHREPDETTAKAYQSLLSSNQMTIDGIANERINLNPSANPLNTRIFNSNQKLRVKMATRLAAYKYNDPQQYPLYPCITHVNYYDDVKWNDPSLGLGSKPPNNITTVPSAEWTFATRPFTG